MTWIVGASSLFGYGAVISDVQVTLANGKTLDVVQKAYPLGRFVVGGFAGSVCIGFRLVDSFRKMLQLPSDVASHKAWDPIWAAKEWTPKAQAIFAAAPEAEKRLGAKFLIVGVSPNQYFAGSQIAKVKVVRFSSPYFLPQFLRESMALCHIGSGSKVPAYKRAIKPLLDYKVAPVQIETLGPGWWAKNLAHAMSNEIVKNPYSGVSRHLNVTAFNQHQLIQTNNDEIVFRQNQEEPDFISMPALATSYQDFIKMVNTLSCDPSAATC